MNQQYNKVIRQAAKQFERGNNKFCYDLIVKAGNMRTEGHGDATYMQHRVIRDVQRVLCGLTPTRHLNGLTARFLCGHVEDVTSDQYDALKHAASWHQCSNCEKGKTPAPVLVLIDDHGVIRVCSRKFAEENNLQEV